MGFSWLNNHQATYFWKPIRQLLSLLFRELAKSTEREKSGTFGEQCCWFWLEGSSKSSNYKNTEQTEVYWCISESQRIALLVLWIAKKGEKMLRLILGAGAYTFYGFSYFFRRQTLRGGREMELSKGDIHSQQQPNIQEQKNIWRVSASFLNATRVQDTPSG